jgi:PIN domain nuclease of toxin-antitoxin system
VGGVARLKLLLDTHIWLWILHNPKKVGKRLWQELRNEANKLWLSPISTPGKHLTLNSKGRIHDALRPLSRRRLRSSAQLKLAARA